MCQPIILVMNYAFANEIYQLMIKERTTLGLQDLPECIWFIFGTLIEIHKSSKNETDEPSSNDYKKIYSMNNIVS